MERLQPFGNENFDFPVIKAEPIDNESVEFKPESFTKNHTKESAHNEEIAIKTENCGDVDEDVKPQFFTNCVEIKKDTIQQHELIIKPEQSDIAKKIKPPKIRKRCAIPVRTYCCIKGCHSTHSPTVSSHKLPEKGFRNVKIQNYKGEFETIDSRKAWLTRLKIDEPMTNRFRVCSLHFTSTDYIPSMGAGKRRKLKTIAVPSINLP